MKPTPEQMAEILTETIPVAAVIGKELDGLSFPAIRFIAMTLLASTFDEMTDEMAQDFTDALREMVKRGNEFEAMSSWREH